MLDIKLFHNPDVDIKFRSRVSPFFRVEELTAALNEVCGARAKFQVGVKIILITFSWVSMFEEVF